MDTNVVQQLRFVSERAPTLKTTESLFLSAIFVRNFLRLGLLLCSRKRILRSLILHFLFRFRFMFHDRRRLSTIAREFHLQNPIGLEAALAEPERVNQVSQTVSANVLRRIVLL